MVEGRKLSRNSFGKARLISIKDGPEWSGCLWVKEVKSLRAFDAMSEEEQDKHIIQRCPRGVHYSMNLPTEYPYVPSECKKPEEGENNCPLLFRYADSQMYDCRLVKKTAEARVYDPLERD